MICLDCFKLAEKRAVAVECVVSPMTEQARVSGVTSTRDGSSIMRHGSTCWRRSLMIGMGSYCCFAVEMPTPSKIIACRWRQSCVCAAWAPA
jgi:hypothetical protein